MSGTIATATARDPSALTPKLRATLAIVLIADIVDLMDSTITNIAAPTITAEIGGGESLVKWLGASYALAMGVLLVVGGRLGDRFGKRRMFLVGIAGFGLASLLCGLAVDPAMLITARLLQGGLGALLIPQGMGLLIANFSREQFPRAASAFGPVMGGAAVLGPIVAGFLIGANIGGLTWRPVFLINIVLCAVGLVAALRLLPRDTDLRPSSIDGLGAGLLGASMLGLIYGLIDGSTAGWTAAPVAWLIAGALFLALFGVRQVKARDPLIRPSLLRNRGFTAGLLLGLGYFAAVNGFAYVISLFFQLGRGLSPELAALGLSPMMAGIIASSFVARPLIPRLGRGLVVAGLLVTLLGAAGLLVTALAAGPSLNAWLTAPSILVLGAGMGACFSSIYDVAIGDVDGDEAGSASGSLSSVQQLAAAIGSAVVTTVYFAQARHATAVHALTVSVAVVAAIAVACLAMAWRLPAKAPAEDW